MGVGAITNRQIMLLKFMAERSPVVAPWNNRDLCDLLGWGLVDRQFAYTAARRLHTSLVWTVSDRGRLFLADERGGQ